MRVASLAGNHQKHDNVSWLDVTPENFFFFRQHENKGAKISVDWFRQYGSERRGNSNFQHKFPLSMKNRFPCGPASVVMVCCAEPVQAISNPGNMC